MNVFTDNSAIGRLVRTWTDFSQPIGQRVYLTHGFSLAAVKYLGDVALVYAATGTLWTPVQYVEVGGLPSSAPWWLGPALLIWMLPFLAIGVTLTMRRAVDANRSPWLSVLFLVPYLNYVLIAILAFAPSDVPSEKGPHRARRARWDTATTVPLAGGAGLAIALLMVVGGLSTFNTYGAWLFLLTPFAMGAGTAFVYNRGRHVSGRDTMALVVANLAVAGVALLLLGFEGIICLVMALPLAIPMAMIGGSVGRWAATSGSRRASPAAFMLLVVPLAGVVEPPTGHSMHEVQSSVVIDAAPAAVWPHVVAFGELPPPRDWVFRAGVAYPVRARIEGTGVGAVRYCVFSTGPFVEPITRWEPGRRLSFDVVESPATMRELSPYAGLSPPHLHGYLRSNRGEFRLVDLGDGRTKLEGSTWYEIEMAPEVYWQLADHQRCAHSADSPASARSHQTGSGSGAKTG